MRIRAQAADNAAFDEEARPFTDGQTESIFQRILCKKLVYFLTKNGKKQDFQAFFFPNQKKIRSQKHFENKKYN